MMNDDRDHEGQWRISPLRGRRKQAYIASGFLPFEQEAFSHVPLSVPYSITMRKDRKREYERAKMQGISRKKYVDAILLKYEVNQWRIPGQPFNKADAYRMLRYYEAEWRRTADPNDPYLLRSTRKHHGHRELIDKGKVNEQKRRYNALPSTKEKRRKYRLENRDKIALAEKKRKLFKRGLA